MTAAALGWRVQRLRKMSPTEVAGRLSDRARQAAWGTEWATRRRTGDPARSGRSARQGGAVPRELERSLLDDRRQFATGLDPGACGRVPSSARAATIAAADEILAGRWTVLGVVRHDMADPDWFLDPVTRRRAPQTDLCFRIDHRAPSVTGNVKQVWELSRLHHLTVLAAAFALTGHDRYAERVDRHLRSWWARNPFLSGIHWTSGIEVGLRLVAWVWTRRLLDGWEGAPALFEENGTALAQIWWHQRFLAAFRSRGSSANNHVIAEAAGQLVAGLAFGWFTQSERWASRAAAVLEEELERNTFPSGLNRELASEYHGLVAELGLVAALEGDRAGRPVSERTWLLLRRMIDTGAAAVDVRLRPPRQGDGDGGRALVLEDPGVERWPGLLALGAELFGPLAWWPPAEPSTTSTLLASMARRPHLPRAGTRPERRPDHLPDAGMAILRTDPSDGPEIWCRCDGGPHGFLSIAAHAHADALSVEVRHDGVDILADPGTYCYHGEERWRRYFRSTLAHNTVEIDGRDQSEPRGPFLWTRQARSRVVDIELDDSGGVTGWSAEHDGYERLAAPAIHRREVRLDKTGRRIRIVDDIEAAGSHRLRLAFHLGPDVEAELDHRTVALRWAPDGSATLHLPNEVDASLLRGSTDPVLGWYSARFGERQPAVTILGELHGAGRCRLETVLDFGRRAHGGAGGRLSP